MDPLCSHWLHSNKSQAQSQNPKDAIMKLLVLLLLSCFVGGYMQEEKPQTGGDAQFKHHRIIGGHLVTVKNFPYTVSLFARYNRTHHKATDLFAGGAVIISDYWVVTAAHCILLIEKYGFIKQGKAFVRGNTTYVAGHVGNNYHLDHKIVLAVTHDKYDDIMNDYDVGVIKVMEKFTGIYEKPIKFPRSNYLYKPGTEVTVLGWGVTSENKSDNVSELRAVIVNLIDNETCAMAYIPFHYSITSQMVCAGAPGKDACNKDSGGPMVDGNILLGLVSWGVGCASDKYPGVYTNVKTLSNWIHQTIREH